MHYWILGCSLLVSSVWGQGSLPTKKIIAHSWDLLAVRPADVARNVDQWAALPLDGVTLALVKTNEKGTVFSFGSIMTDPSWERAFWVSEIDTLRKCSSRTLRHNFLTSFWAPRKRLAWSDDAAWGQFATNLNTLAWLAKEGGAQGILIDPEDYTQTRQYFLHPGEGTFADTAALARKRGAQVMRSMSAAYPSIHILSFWLLSMTPTYLEGMADDAAARVQAAGDLWPSFVNGMLDALPPDARLIDGNEHGYLYEATRNDFYYSAWKIQNKGLMLVAPENRSAYQTRVSVGFGLYLDMYTNPKGTTTYYFGELNGSRINHFERNLAQALEASSEYIWLYGEKYDWIRWQGTSRKQPLWSEKLHSGMNDVLRLATHPVAAAREIIQRRQAAGTLSNRLENARFQSAKEPGGALPPPWSSWQMERTRHGVFQRACEADASFIRATGVENGCLIAQTRTQPGELLAVSGEGKGGPMHIRVRWQVKGAWTLDGLDVQIPFPPTAQKEEWRPALGVVRVPEGVDTVVYLWCVHQQKDESGALRNPAIYSVFGGKDE